MKIWTDEANSPKFELMILAPRMLSALAALDDYIVGKPNEDYKTVNEVNFMDILDNAGFPYALLQELKELKK
jgi:hypothetical protein